MPALLSKAYDEPTAEDPVKDPTYIDCNDTDDLALCLELLNITIEGCRKVGR